MTEEENKNLNTEQEESIDLQALFLKYFAYWPWFIASVIACLFVAFLYIRFCTPQYSVGASLLIKEEDKSQSSGGASPLATIQDFGMFSMSNNFDNEVEILKSRTLIKKVVTDLGLYQSIYEKRLFGYNTPLYKNAPVNIFMSAQQADLLKAPVELDITYLPNKEMNVKVQYVLEKEEYEIKQTFNEMPAVMPTPVGVITFTPDSAIIAEREDPEETINLKAFISSPTSTARGYANSLTVEAVSKTTTIAKLNLTNSDKTRAADFINHLIYVYNEDANNEKNEVAQKTADFIEERINIINEELGTTETNLADFKQRSGMTTDLEMDAQIILEENSKYEQQRVQNETQINLVTYLKEYINNPQNKEEVIPANVGLEDGALTAAIEQYNNMIIEKKKLLRTSSENNPAIINMNAGIEAMEKSVRTTIESVLKGLLITKDDIEKQARKFEGRISNAPQMEKELIGISRQQEIKASLYIMLLQKREENAITLASTANNGRIIEETLPGEKPVAPKKMIILLGALVLGLGIPVGIIYLYDLTRFKIENRTDVEKLTKVPLIAELPQVGSNDNIKPLVRENQNDIMEETFRGLRTNLLFMLKPQEKVIMFSSTQPGEGKSFVAGNTALSLAYLGKKVIIVGLDIRKPGLNKVFSLQRSLMGITNYLADPENNPIDSLIIHSEISPNLDILPGGPIPPNPTELVSRNTLDQGIEYLKARYDYIIVDSAPIAMVPDTIIIGRIADTCVYVCRADVTPKVGFDYINELVRLKKFSNLAVVLNGIDFTKRKNTYGYGAKYGYHKGYGYGYSDINNPMHKKKKA